MKKIFYRLTALTLIFCLMLSLSGCIFDKWGEDIADSIVSEFDASKNDPIPKGKKGVNEQVLYETVLLEDVLEEKIITEDILKERIITEIVNYEPLQGEDIIIESVVVEIYDDINEMEDDFCCESYSTIDFDYSFIKQRIAAGVSLVLAEVVVDTGSAIINLVTFQWGSLALDLGQIIVTAGGTTISAFVASQVAKAKSLAAGNSYEVAMYDALYEGSNAFYYTAVSIDAINTAISLGQLVDLGVKGVKELVSFVKSKAAVDIVDAAGKVVGKATAKGTYTIMVDGVERTCLAARATNLSGTIDLYDAATKTYVTTLSRTGDVLLEATRTIPGEILLKAGDNVGKAKYIFDGTDAYKVTYTQNGEATRTWIGIIDQGGYIKNNFGQIVKKIDFDTGKEINGFSKLIKASQENKITVDVFGELVEITDVSTQATKALTKRTIDGTITYLDSAKNKIFTEYVGRNGVTYLMRASDNINNAKVSGSLVNGGFDFNWKVNLDFIRSNATSTIRKRLVEYVQNNNINLIRQNFPELTLEMIDYIKQYGRVPTSIQIHHCRNVANFPDLAGDYRNLVVLTRESHLAEHFGDFHNATMSNPSVYIDLEVLFGL